MASSKRLLFLLGLILVVFTFFITSQVAASLDQITGESLEIEGKHKHVGGQSYSNRRMGERDGVMSNSPSPSRSRSQFPKRCCTWERGSDCCPGDHI
ncbi:hypothetical protein ACS0TY_017345 [Phlomoides rotata]